MGYLELQYREARMAEAIRVELNAMSMPLDDLEELLLDGQMIDNWECLSVAFVSSGPSGPAANGTVIAQAEVEFRLTTPEAAKAAGSGNPPAVTPVAMVAWIAISGTSDSGGALDRQLLGVEVSGIPVPAPPLPLGPIEIPATTDVTIVTSWAGRGGGNVVFRLGTPVAGPLGGPAIVDRVPSGQDWAVLLSGTLLAETTEAMITEAANESDEAQIEEAFQASWLPHLQAVACNGWIVVPDQCGFLNVDFSVEISALVTFSFDLDEDDPLGMRVKITWDTSDWDSFVCAFGMAMIGGLIALVAEGLVALVFPPAAGFTAGLGFGVTLAALIAVPILIEDIVDEQAGGGATPAGLEEVDSDDDSVTYAGQIPLSAPSIGGVTATVNAKVPSMDGVVLVGTLSLPVSVRNLSLFVVDPHYVDGYSCDTSSWFSEYHDGKVTLASGTPGFRLRSVPEVTPASDWLVQDPDGLMAASDQALKVIVSPIGSSQVGSVAELLVHTTAGMRWIQFDPVPAVPDPPSAEKLMFWKVQCAVEGMIDRPDDWPFGFFNPRWHIDPPPYEHVFRQWGFVYDSLPAGSVVTFSTVEDHAIDARAVELGRVVVDASRKLAETFVTSSTQRVIVNVDGAMRQPTAPRMRQEWLAVVAEVAGAQRGAGRRSVVGGRTIAGRSGSGRRTMPDTLQYDRGAWLVEHDGSLLVCVPVGAVTQRGVN